MARYGRAHLIAPHPPTRISRFESGWSTALVTTTDAGSGASVGKIKYWNGSAWVAVPLKSGGTWTTKSLKRWNGSAWVITSS
jgi:hypothetical protein